MKLFKKLFSFFWDRSTLYFVIIGGLNTVFSMLISFALRNFAGWPQFWASALAFAVCSVPSFYFNRKLSFQSKAPLKKSIVKFTVVVTVCFLLSFAGTELFMPWLRSTFTLSTMVESAIQILGIQVVFTLLNYLGQRLWAFKD